MEYFIKQTEKAGGKDLKINVNTNPSGQDIDIIMKGNLKYGERGIKEIDIMELAKRALTTLVTPKIKLEEIDGKAWYELAVKVLLPCLFPDTASSRQDSDSD